MRYLDRNGNSITDGCTIRYEDGKTERVYLMNDGVEVIESPILD